MPSFGSERRLPGHVSCHSIDVLPSFRAVFDESQLPDALVRCRRVRSGREAKRWGCERTPAALGGARPGGEVETSGHWAVQAPPRPTEDAEDCLVDALLLASCDAFIHADSNLTIAAGIMCLGALFN